MREYMHYNFSKTDVRSNLEVKIENDIIPHVSQFKYLRSIIPNNGAIDKDVTDKIQVEWLKWKKA